MAQWTRRVARCTIRTRLILLVLLPSIALFFFAALTVSDEREAARVADDLRHEAELVELLSTSSVRLAVEHDSLLSVRQALTLGVDPEVFVDGEWRQAAQASAENLDRLWVHLAAMEGIPSDQWADPVSVAEVNAGWRALQAWEADRSLGSEPPDEGIELTTTLAASLDRARRAQATRLENVLDRTKIDGDLSTSARILSVTFDLTDAAQRERRALSDYLLPLTDRTDEENYLDLVEAVTRFDVLFEDLADALSGDGLDTLMDLEGDAAWRRYEELRSAAISGQRTPPGDGVDLPILIPDGIVLYIDGVSRIEILIGYQLDGSSDFTARTVALQSDAERNLWLALLTAVGMALVTSMACMAAIRSITAPIRALRDRAVRITNGDLDTVSPRSSPFDIDQVHRAMDEMSANLRTLSHQTAALSDGRLDDEVLNERVAGQLGASVHGSLNRLRTMTTRLEYEANHDALTGLPNRAALLSLLDRCLTGSERDRTPLAAIMFDLDGFKQANDDMGHSIGDEVLIHISRRLRSAVENDFASRLGGDEFMVVIAGESAMDRARVLADNVVEAIGRPIVTSAGTVTVSASVGIVAAGSPDWISSSEVLRRVDLAMYEAKSDSPGLVVEFDQRLHDSLLETTQLQGEIRKALDRDQFEIHLQPIVSLPDRRVVGFESLLRWNSPVRGPVAPALFIPVAEQTDLVTHIDNWVVEKTCEMLGRWRSDPALSGFTLSANISARHLSHPDLVDRVRSAINRHGVVPDRYVLEITESQLIPNLARAEANLRGLAEVGLQLAIDDFGTGYASVAHLRRVRFDRLKIDQSFVSDRADETDRSLAALMVSVGRDLELEVVAEGVETENEARWALEVGCTHAQGFLTGMPAPPETVLAELTSKADHRV